MREFADRGGVKKSENFADVIYGSPLKRIPLYHHISGPSVHSCPECMKLRYVSAQVKEEKYEGEDYMMEVVVKLNSFFAETLVGNSSVIPI